MPTHPPTHLANELLLEALPPTEGNGPVHRPICEPISQAKPGAKTCCTGLSPDVTHMCNSPFHVTNPKDFKWLVVQITGPIVRTSNATRSNGLPRSTPADHDNNPATARSRPSILRVTRSTSAPSYKYSKLQGPLTSNFFSTLTIFLLFQIINLSIGVSAPEPLPAMDPFTSHSNSNSSQSMPLLLSRASTCCNNIHINPIHL